MDVLDKLAEIEARLIAPSGSAIWIGKDYSIDDLRADLRAARSVAMTAVCDRCDEEMEAPGALLFSPPEADGMCVKVNLCVSCYGDVRWYIAEYPGPADDEVITACGDGVPFRCPGCGQVIWRDPVPASYDPERGYRSWCCTVDAEVWCPPLRVVRDRC